MIVSIEYAREVYLQIVSGVRSSSQPLLILVSPDVDSLCAAKILISEFVLFDLIVLSSFLELSEINEKYFEPLQDGHRYLIMINCGATVDLDAIFSLSDGSCIVVFDHHRPVHLNNLFAPEQVKIFDDGELFSTASYMWPFFQLTENIVNNNHESDPASSHSEGEVSEHHSDDECTENLPNAQERGTMANGTMANSTMANGTRVNGTMANSTMANGTRVNGTKAEAEVNSYYDRETGVGVSASCFIYSIASQLVKTNNELLWACIVGACSLFQIQTISLDRYINDVNLLEKEVLRLNSNTLLGNCDIYLEENSLNLSLFKHWTLFKSLMYSIHSASKFQTLSEKGKRRIEIFLAKIGVSLSEANQPYVFLEPSIRRRIASQVEKSFTEEGVVNPTISVFIRKFSTNIKFSATDYIHAIQGLLWYPYTKRKDKERNVARSNFLLSLGIFSGYLQFFICSKNSHSILERGLKLSKAHLERIHRTASMLLSNKTIKTIKSFKLCVLPHDQTEASPSISKDDTGKEIASPQIDWWASNSALASLSLFLCEYCNMPLLVAHFIRGASMYNVVGCAPKHHNFVPKMYFCITHARSFGSAFKKAALDTGSSVRTDGIENAWAIQVASKDLSRFMQRLQFYFPLTEPRNKPKK
ncbi:DNA replication initiation factor cdc45 [Mitosporidium daphniae]